MINGAPTDNNAKLFKEGAHSVFDRERRQDRQGVRHADWSPDKAQQEMEQAITALGEDGFDGVYAANDGTAGGAIAAMKSAGIEPADRPTTGPGRRARRHPADPRRRAVHDGLQGDQARGQTAAAEIAVALAQGEEPPADLVNDETDNGKKEVPSVLLDPVAVTKDNIKDTVVKDGFWKAVRDLHRQVRGACKEAGIQ